MGVYYYFYNITRTQTNELPIKGYGQCTFVAKLNSLAEDHIIEIFKDVINDNGWSGTDIIRASPDYHYFPYITYDNGTVEYEDMEDYSEQTLLSSQ